MRSARNTFVVPWRARIAFPPPADRSQTPPPPRGRAPGFVFCSHDGPWRTLDQFRGKVVAVTFIFASCSTTCPILTAKTATVQDRLGSDFGSKIVFLSITVDPEHARPEFGAQALPRDLSGADPAGWKFLSGSAMMRFGRSNVVTACSLRGYPAASWTTRTRSHWSIACHAARAIPRRPL